jgi:hypothetical protein
LNAIHGAHLFAFFNIGQLEITFLQQFCRAGNLRALLASPHLFPDTLRPLIPSLQELYEPISATIKKTQLEARLDYLTDTKAEKLIHLLNAKGPSECWAVASVWTQLSVTEKEITLPLPSRCHSHQHFLHKNVTFSTWSSNCKNSVVTVQSKLPRVLRFVLIESIITHEQVT